jgi:chromate reductase
MKDYNVGVIVGSLRKDSINRRLAESFKYMAPDNITLHDISIGQLPLYNQDHDNNISTTVQAFKNQVEAMDGIIFVTPEYNRSVPGVLKNAIDQGSRPFKQNSWAGKPAGIIGASIGALGSALAQQHLRNIVAFLDMPCLSQPEAFLHITDDFFDSNGLIGPKSHDFVATWLARYSAWLQVNSK